MDEFARLVVLMAITGGAFTVLGAAFVWYLDESRRIRRSLKKVLGAEAHALLVSRGRGPMGARGIGFDFGANTVAVTWDVGAWCLLYRIDELMGAELIVDGQVAARTHRGEARRALDHLAGAQDHVRLRFVFDDPAYPDFIVELWGAGQQDKRQAWTAAEAVQEGNRWIARMESLLRRPVPKRGAVLTAPPAAPETPRHGPSVADDADDADDDAEHAA